MSAGSKSSDATDSCLTANSSGVATIASMPSSFSSGYSADIESFGEEPLAADEEMSNNSVNCHSGTASASVVAEAKVKEIDAILVVEEGIADSDIGLAQQEEQRISGADEVGSSQTLPVCVEEKHDGSVANLKRKRTGHECLGPKKKSS